LHARKIKKQINNVIKMTFRQMPEGHFYVAHSSCGGGILRRGYCWLGCDGVSGTSAKLENNPIINVAGTRTVILFFQ
jgi:Ni,Fe-hydrogenase III small subunit